MRKHNGAGLLRILMVSAILASVAGCSSLNIESKKVDYKSAAKAPSLETPPDLTALNPDDRFVVPDVNSQGSATYSVYNQERSGQAKQNAKTVLPDVPKVSLERAGSQRWLVVNESPEKVWPQVKEFWQELGFVINIETPQAGIMETDWAENRAKIPMDPIRGVLSKVFDSVYSTAERDKFRTRLEDGKAPDTTEIYISHRGMYEVIKGGDGGNQTVWEPRPADPELEAEMLRRLMVRFGVQESRAKTMMAANTLPERAKITRDGESGDNLTVSDTFDRAWRRVGLALDRVGFTVEDRDRSKGIYYVRYVDPELDNQKEDSGWFSKLAFWRGNGSKTPKEQYQIVLTETGDNTKVEVRGKDGGPEKSGAGSHILNLLYEQLK